MLILKLYYVLDERVLEVKRFFNLVTHFCNIMLNLYVANTLLALGPYDLRVMKAHLVCKTLVNVQTPNSKFPKQAYIQIMYVRNIKYKQYPNMQTTLSHILITTQQ